MQKKPFFKSALGLIAADLGEMLRVFAFGLFGVYAIIAGLEGYLEHPLSWWVRLIMFPVGALMLWPHDSLMLDFAGLGIFIAMLVWSARKGNGKQDSAQQSPVTA